MKTDMEDLIGKWSVEKLELLGKYSAAYLKLLQHQSWYRGYAKDKR